MSLHFKTKNLPALYRILLLIYFISTNQQSFLALTVICTDLLSHPLGSSGECTLTVQQKLTDWTGNFFFDSACLFSWTRLTSVDLSSQVQQSSARALLCTNSHPPTKRICCLTIHKRVLYEQVLYKLLSFYCTKRECRKKYRNLTG